MGIGEQEKAGRARNPGESLQGEAGGAGTTQERGARNEDRDFGDQERGGNKVNHDSGIRGRE